MTPEMGSGKTRVLEVTGPLCNRPHSVTNISVAALYRLIDMAKPTLFADELDTIFDPKLKSEKNEELRGIINSGNRPDTPVLRFDVKANALVGFDAFCPKMLAGIGRVPDTVASRGVPLGLKKKKRSEQVAPYKRREALPRATPVFQAIAQWATENSDKVRERYDAGTSASPEGLQDRMEEAVEPLVVIADELGCGAELRGALTRLLTVEGAQEQHSYRLRLLHDLRQIWHAAEAGGDRQDGLHTEFLLQHLHAIEEGPWATYYDHKLDARDLASLLRHYGITSQDVKRDGVNRKGYRRMALQDAWERYLGDENATPESQQ